MNPIQPGERRPLSPIPEEETPKVKILAPKVKRLVHFEKVSLDRYFPVKNETVVLIDITYRFVIRFTEENKEEGKK